MPPYLIGHVDADCFYVSAERVRNDFLRDKPVGVLGNHGACVIAKSYEMKRAGVPTGMPIWEAVKLCPEGIYLKRDFRWYEVLSRRMLDIVRAFSPTVEYYSIDECFFAVPGSQSLQAAAEALRDQLWREVRVPVTVGIGRSKTIAKLISDSAKPFGARALLDQDEVTELLAELPVTDICGIAARRAARLAPYGIHSCLDFARADRKLIRKVLTIDGERLWWELNGEAVRPILTQRPPHKVLSRGGSLGEHTADPMRIWAWVVRNLERLVEELEYHAVAVGRLTVFLVHRGGVPARVEVALDAPTDRFDLLLEAAREAVGRAWLRSKEVHRVHLIATHLRRPGDVQLGLFEPPAGRARAVARLKREINAKLGRFVIRSGATLPLAAIYADGAHGYDICDVRGKICF